MYERVSALGTAIGRQADLRMLQNDLARLTAEMSSGRKADPAREMGVGASLLYKLHGEIQKGESVKSVANQAGLRLDTMQAALTDIAKLMEGISTQTLQVDALEGDGYKTIAENARSVMASIASLLNTPFNKQNVFAGTDSAHPPVRSSDALLDRARGLLGGAVTAGGALDAAEASALLGEVDTLFNRAVPDAEFYGLVYQSGSRTGDGAPSRIRIGAGETLSYDIRADNQAFKDAFQSLAVLSMLDAPDSELSAEARTALLDEAGSLMRGAQSQITTLAGVLGIKQARLDSVAEIQSRAITAATAQVNDLEGVDYYTISDRISALEVQLQATYAVTARLNELSLVNYL